MPPRKWAEDGSDLPEYVGDEPEAEQIPEEIQGAETIDQYLDRVAHEQLEWDRVMDDLYPMDNGDMGVSAAHVHRDTDEVQRYYREQRANG